MSKPKHPGSKPEDAHPHPVAADEVVHVPKGRSRGSYLLLTGLAILTLIIFVVPQEFQTMFKPRRARDAAYVTWNDPKRGPQSISEIDFQLARRRLQNFFRVAGIPTNDLLDDDGLARLLVIDSLAQDAGVEVADRELGEQILRISKSPDKQTFLARCEQAKVAPLDFQEGLRQMLRIDRYESLVEGVLALPDPEQLEKQWKQQNQEYALDFVEVEVAASMDAATAELPADAELKTWFDALPNKRALFQAEWKPERASAELVVYRIDGDDPAALLAKYPRPEGADLEQLAKDYYNQFANVRFRRPEEKADAQDVRERLYLPFDEVADRARRESKIYGALVDWQRDYAKRIEAQETVDLAAETALYGLSTRIEATPKSQAEWSTLEGFGGSSLADAVMRAARAQVKLVNVTVSERDMAAGRVPEYLPAGPPPFEEVHDKAATEWKKQRAVELAKGKLNTIFEALKAATPAPAPDPTNPDAPVVAKAIAESAAFEAKATEAGFTVLHTDWFQRDKLPKELSESPSEVERLLSDIKTSGRFLYGLETNEVAAPQPDSKNERVWLVHSLGKRDPAQAELAPKDLENLSQMATYTNQQRLREEVFSTKGFTKSLGLKLRERDAPPADAPSGS